VWEKGGFPDGKIDGRCIEKTQRFKGLK